MVRETRFSCDAEEAFNLPGWRDAMWDLDDFDLEPPPRKRTSGRDNPSQPVTSPEAEDTATNVVSSQGSRRTGAKRTSAVREGRHLAGADWLGATGQNRAAPSATEVDFATIRPSVQSMLVE